MGPLERQYAHAMDAVRERVVLFGEVIVGGAASGDAKFGFAQLRDVAGAGGEEHRLFDIVFAHDLEPRLDLLGRTHAAIVATVAEGIKKVRVERLVGRPQARVAAVPRRFEIFADVALTFQHMSIGIYYWGPVSHIITPPLNWHLGLRRWFVSPRRKVSTVFGCVFLGMCRSRVGSESNCVIVTL